MKRKSNCFIIEKLKYATVCYTPWVESVKLTIQEHYDKPEYNNTIILINCLPEFTETNVKILSAYNKRIYYILEHKTSNEDYYKTWFKRDCDLFYPFAGKFNINEVWTMDYGSQVANELNKQFGIPIKYLPVRYTSLINKIPNISESVKTVDCCMVGLLQCPMRYDFYVTLENRHDFSFKGITQTDNLSSVIPELNSSRYILDIPRRYDSLTQNQVRIFELLCMGYTVITKKFDVNLFPGLVYEYESYDDIVNIVNKNEYLHPTEAYKEMTYTDEAYEQYVNNLIQLQNGI